MQPLASALEAHNCDVALATLRGHRLGESLNDVRAEMWIEDVADVYRTLTARNPGVPCYGVGFSLGGALILSLLLSNRNVRFSKLCLFAPALYFTSWGRIRRSLLPLSKCHLALPSFVHSSLRVHAWTALQGYSALFEIADSITSATNLTPVSNVQTKIFLSEMDELVDSTRVKRWIAERGLDYWTFAALAPTFEKEVRKKHLIVDPNNLGSHWVMIRNDMVSFLLGDTP